MSLIVGQYYRGNPKQKPKQWGSESSVVSLAKQKDSVSALYPCWEYREIINKSNLSVTYGAPELINNSIFMTDNGNGVTNDILYSQNRFGTWGMSTTWLLELIPTYSASHYLHNIFGPTSLYITYSQSTESLSFSIMSNSRGWSKDFNGILNIPVGKRLQLGVIIPWNGSGFDIAKAIINGVIYPLNFINPLREGDIDTEWDHVRIGHGGYTNYYGYTGYINLISKYDRALTQDEVSFYYDNPYYLIQPPTFRTYFDLAEAGTTLSFTSINSNSDLNNNFLSAIRLLNPTNISCFTEISASIISGLVNLISGNDLLADSQITQASVQAIRKLLGQEISSVSQITDIVISTAKQFNLTDLNSLTEVTNVVFSVIHQINNNDLLSNSQVINLAIDVIRQININSIESISNITEVVLSITGGIRGIDVEAQTEITSLALSILRVLKENNVESNSSVNEATLNVIHKLDFNNISSLSEITDIVTVAGSNIGIKDNNSLTQITQVILDIIKAVSPININIQSEIDNPVINVLRTLFSNTVNVISNVTSVGVTNISTIATGKVTITFSMAVPSISWSLE